MNKYANNLSWLLVTALVLASCGGVEAEGHISGQEARLLAKIIVAVTDMGNLGGDIEGAMIYRNAMSEEGYALTVSVNGLTLPPISTSPEGLSGILVFPRETLQQSTPAEVTVTLEGKPCTNVSNVKNNLEPALGEGESRFYCFGFQP